MLRNITIASRILFYFLFQAFIALNVWDLDKSTFVGKLLTTIYVLAMVGELFLIVSKKHSFVRDTFLNY